MVQPVPLGGTVGGPTGPGDQFSLQLTYQGALAAALEERTDLTSEFISFYVRRGVGGMPFFRKTEISDADLAALGVYLSKNRPQ